MELKSDPSSSKGKVSNSGKKKVKEKNVNTCFFSYLMRTRGDGEGDTEDGDGGQGWGEMFESVEQLCTLKSFFFPYNIQHCFICRPSDSTVPKDAGIEPRTVATGALAVRRSNH